MIVQLWQSGWSFREDASSLSAIRSAEKGRQVSHGCRKRQHQRKDVETKPGKLIHFHIDEALDVPAVARDLLDAHQLNHACFQTLIPVRLSVGISKLRPAMQRSLLNRSLQYFRSGFECVPQGFLQQKLHPHWGSVQGGSLMNRAQWEAMGMLPLIGIDIVLQGAQQVVLKEKVWSFCRLWLFVSLCDPPPFSSVLSQCHLNVTQPSRCNIARAKQMHVVPLSLQKYKLNGPAL